MEIGDFISPTIVERLQAEADLLKPKIDIGLSDVPEKKTDLVSGRYELPPPVGRTVAVKIIDMLGEEVPVTLHPKE